MPERVETQGSWWTIDDEAGRYMRMPKEEKPRPNGWGGYDAGVLQDLVWHPMRSWSIDADRGRLRIIAFGDDGDDVFVGAPLTFAELVRRGLIDAP